ncbi:MAG: Asp-tRNA(Asn)/Glu-tRNA(Gln) amidotransferase subunit GatC [Clostridia bacterium]|nr:Asp-tRNA(Asn)/Glu-tRNA(Gln) amidotransferase subunit GatC [Clostridia bacterium]HCA54959.1 Asp-tRNA(Asn)/Glu-tRNA(Gln) amidotransferase subunit GatC [Oscillospiraceae bacterium]
MVDKEEIMKIAILSKLFVGEDEIEQLTEDMSKIISFADTINQASEEGTEFDNINNLSNVFREDEVVPSYERDRILSNAKDSDEGCFLVKNIMR